MDIIEDWERKITAYKSIILLGVLVLVGGYVLYSFFRHPISTGDPKEVPLIGSQIAAAIPDQHEPVPADEEVPASHPEARGSR